MTAALLLNLLGHLQPNPPIAAVTTIEVAELRGLGYVEHHGLALTDAGRARLTELKGKR